MYTSVIKPLLDRVLALILLVVLAPIMLLLSLAIYFKLGSPLLFVQRRPGLNAKIFKIYKFRTMSSGYDKNGNLLSDEQRLDFFGKIIRSLSLDELPQLFNVLKGEMSFIGPRPLLVEYLELYNDRQKRRHELKPGITGWAQVNGRNAISWEQKFELDVWYVDHVSLWLDIKIAYLTILKVIKRDNISSQDSVTADKFRGSQSG